MNNKKDVMKHKIDVPSTYVFQNELQRKYNF